MTSGNPPDRRVLPFPRARKLVIDACRYGKRKNTIRGLLSMDVTEPRRRIAELEERTGERISFTAFVIHCLAAAVAEDRTLHAYRDWRGRLVVFDDVDVNAIVEREVEGAKMGVVHLIRAADRKGVKEIHADLLAARARPVRTREHPFWRAYLALPGFVRGWIWRIAGRFPSVVKRAGGTVAITAVGMHARGGGWGIGIGSHTLGLTLGGIETRPRVVEDEIVVREMLDVTCAFDHDVIDGAPAARFTRRLKERVERGDGLPEARR
ncbi:MAG: 2-oxo acid dehydrogenase subunit E2 [Gemmatimonadota bacterium]|nr:2-oxo acid dehydrogenase subunit E2 [Gemmatimonadota bacterium]